MKLKTESEQDYSIGCLLDYKYIKNHYKLIAVDLSRQKELDANPKAIQQIELVGQLKDIDGVNADETQSMFVCLFGARLKFPEGSVTAL